MFYGGAGSIVSKFQLSPDYSYRVVSWHSFIIWMWLSRSRATGSPPFIRPLILDALTHHVDPRTNCFFCVVRHRSCVAAVARSVLYSHIVFCLIIVVCCILFPRRFTPVKFTALAIHRHRFCTRITGHCVSASVSVCRLMLYMIYAWAVGGRYSTWSPHRIGQFRDGGVFFCVRYSPFHVLYHLTFLARWLFKVGILDFIRPDSGCLVFLYSAVQTAYQPRETPSMGYSRYTVFHAFFLLFPKQSGLSVLYAESCRAYFFMLSAESSDRLSVIFSLLPNLWQRREFSTMMIVVCCLGLSITHIFSI